MHVHGHDRSHHGHAHDQGLAGSLRYLRLLPVMWRSPVSDAVVEDVAPRVGERVLDLGAGMGAATVGAARTGASVLAVDPTPFMRAVLRLRFGWTGRSTVRVLEGAAESIPVEEGSVDALWTVNTIHHWTDRTRAARELARIVRPGGRVLLIDEDMDDPAHPWHERWRARHRQEKPHFEDVDVESLASGLRAAGFARAEGARSAFAGRPAKVVRAVR